MMVIFMLKVKRPFDAYLDEMNKITILLPCVWNKSDISFAEGSNVKDLPIAHTIALPDATKYECFIEEPLDVGSIIQYEMNGMKKQIYK